ncbi:hypothetical protein G7Y89_g8073 [Cudoniella acicularis]|uniref:DUF7704 domain-containing protein n=1 Tax=Cudoniella acicularis TaxID=354080 RepID=A0A8H4RHA7_9HELO|nr:hypothetical protein G7Y89_g8073 [Cudoniella acicularis]
MASILPPFPRLVFTVLEPISLVAGAVAPFISAIFAPDSNTDSQRFQEWFIAEQIALSPLEPVTANARMVAYHSVLPCALSCNPELYCYWKRFSCRPKSALIADEYPRLGNIYLLLAMVGIAVLYTTTEVKVVRNYVIALWLADIGHIAITCYVMEYERVLDVANWNSMTWGNIGATVALFATRTFYLLGFFGPRRQSSSAAKKLQ